MDDVTVVTPFRTDNGRRAQIFEWIRDRFKKVHSGYDLVVATDESEGTFNKSKVMNNTVKNVDTKIVVMMDADSFLTPEHFDLMVQKCRNTDKMVLGFTYTNKLGDRFSTRLMRGAETSLDSGIERVSKSGYGGIFAIPRVLWDEAGGMDEGFLGWGGEDDAFWEAARVVAEGGYRIDGPLWHLWHPQAEPLPLNRFNRFERLKRYRDVDTRTEMLKLISEIRKESDV